MSAFHCPKFSQHQYALKKWKWTEVIKYCQRFCYYTLLFIQVEGVTGKRSTLAAFGHVANTFVCLI